MKQLDNFNEVIMLDLEKIRKELDQKATFKFFKMQRRYQKYYYDYNNLSIILTIDTSTNTACHLSVTKKGSI